MKAPLLTVFLFLSFYLNAQVTTAVVDAGFGVDADLRANVVSKSMQLSDDWFSDGTGNGYPGAGTFIIDTTGAAAIASRYATDPAFRRLPFYRTMRFPSYSVVNNKMLIDGVFIRDYHGDDSTIFASGSNKNGQSPADWQTPVSQSVPAKDDLEDMFVHIRRDGPGSSYPLWLSTGASLIGTTGASYFDFEMYQTDIYYERASRRFYNYGPDAGHTSWVLDGAGEIVKPGDVIFTAEYDNAGLKKVEARIWIHRSTLSITPSDFSWGGSFDGASSASQYGYASIVPKISGDFYTGIQNKASVWAGPFKFIDGNNNVQTDYSGGQFMEFSVNLTKLGLDPVTMLGGSACGLPFRRVLAKTRSSPSFSAELKDFVGPFDFFLSPKVDAQAEMPVLCSTNGVSKINIVNPYSTSVYTWSTIGGNIADETNKTSIYVDAPGTYIVQQQLMDGCGAYATDTVQVIFDPSCAILSARDMRLSGSLKDGLPLLNWISAINDKTDVYEVQRSIDGMPFETVHKVENIETAASVKSYSFLDETIKEQPAEVSYRIKAKMGKNEFISSAFLLRYPYSLKLKIYPNPASKEVHLSIFTAIKQDVQVFINSISGASIYKNDLSIKPGKNTIKIERTYEWPPGIYIIRVVSAAGIQWQKLLIQNSSLAQ